MLTHAEAEGEAKFDWFQAIDQKIKSRDKIVDHELAHKAQSWTTCACGNQCSVLERDKEGEPKDEVLKQLGTDFYFAIAAPEWGKAKRILKKIEKRSTKLINVVRKKAEKKLKDAQAVLDKLS